jgi:hypothetical protein
MAQLIGGGETGNAGISRGKIMVRIIPITILTALALSLAGCIESDGFHASMGSNPSFTSTSKTQGQPQVTPLKPSASSPDATIRMENRTF